MTKQEMYFIELKKMAVDQIKKASDFIVLTHEKGNKGSGFVAADRSNMILLMLTLADKDDDFKCSLIEVALKLLSQEPLNSKFVEQ